MAATLACFDVFRAKGAGKRRGQKKAASHIEAALQGRETQAVDDFCRYRGFELKYTVGSVAFLQRIV